MTREQAGCIRKQPCQQQVLLLPFAKLMNFNLHVQGITAYTFGCLSFSAAIFRSYSVVKTLCACNVVQHSAAFLLLTFVSLV